jgi:hypothetical protein
MISYPEQYTKPEPVWRGIPGFCDYENVYVRMAEEAPPESIMVEVGCFLGRSACFLGEELQRLNKGVTLLCVDEWPYHYRWGNFIYAESPFDTFCANVRQSGLDKIILPLRCKSLTAARIVGGGLFSVFIDADHTFEGCQADILAWKDKVIPGGYVFGHDYEESGCWESVSRAVKSVYGDDYTVDGRTWIHKQK